MPHKKKAKKKPCGCKKKKKLTEKAYDAQVKTDKKKKESVMVEKPAPHHKFKKGTVEKFYKTRAT